MGEAQVEPEAEKSVFGECTCKRSSPGERLLVKRSPLLLPRSASPACKEIISGFQSSSSYNCRSKSLARTPDQLNRPPLLHMKSRRHSGTLSCATRSWESFFHLHLRVAQFITRHLPKTCCSKEDHFCHLNMCDGYTCYIL